MEGNKFAIDGLADKRQIYWSTECVPNKSISLDFASSRPLPLGNYSICPVESIDEFIGSLNEEVINWELFPAIKTNEMAIQLHNVEQRQVPKIISVKIVIQISWWSATASIIAPFHQQNGYFTCLLINFAGNLQFVTRFHRPWSGVRKSAQS